MATFPLSLPLNDIIPVTVVISPVVPPGPAFNQALILGSSTNIPSSIRLLQFTALTQLTVSNPSIGFVGFAPTDPEYQAAEVYFEQNPAPFYLWIGRRDLTALGAVSVAAGGTGYVIGDIVAVVESANSTGSLVVTGIVSGTGAVNGVNLIPGKQGTGYSTGTALPTTGGTGTGLTVTIVSTGESPAAAMAACRLASPQWYAASNVSLQDSGTPVATTTAITNAGLPLINVTSPTGIAVGQIITGAGILGNTTVIGLIPGTPEVVELSQAPTASGTAVPVQFFAPLSVQSNVNLATFIEAATPPSILFLTSGDPAILNNSPNNLFATLQAASFNRTCPVYATTELGESNQFNAYAGVAAMGYAMGANTGTASSYFTLMFKQLIGIIPEQLTQQQATTISGSADRTNMGLNGNIYVNYANGDYKIFQNGTMASGRFVDITIFLDLLVSEIQYGAMNTLVSQPSIPLNQAGISMMISAITQACVALQTIGFINTSGVWQGVTIGPISPGTNLPKGYYVYSPPASSLTQAQRQNRQFPHMNVLIILAESGQSLAITVNVQP
jgi:hypothetical protein